MLNILNLISIFLIELSLKIDAQYFDPNYDYNLISDNSSNSSIEVDPVKNIFDDDIMSNILKNYNSLVRPSPIVNISLKVSLRQIVTVDVQNQLITTNLYLSLIWLDKRLNWNPSEYSNLKIILIPTSKIWLPDLSVMNTATGNGFITVSSTNLAVLNSNGLVYLILNIAGLQTRCKMNVIKYPFDVQNCSIIIGSWQHDTNRMDFSSDEKKIDLNNFITNPVWKLQQVQVNSIISKNRFISALNLTSEDISFNLIIKRGALYIMINNVYPVLILNAVTLFSYFLPFAAQVTLSMTTFLTYGVYSVRTSSDLPVQSEYFPLISVYFFLSVIYTFVSLGWFFLINNFLTKNEIPILFNPVIYLMHKIRSTIRTSKKQTSTVSAENTNSKSNQTQDQIGKKCMKCETCDECLLAKKAETKKKNAKEELELDLAVLNLAMFYFMFSIVCISNVTLWVQMGSS